MTIRRSVFPLLAVGALGFVSWFAWTQSKTSLPLEKIKLPAGFNIAVYASGVGNARSMTLSPDGTLFVGSRDAGNVYAIVDQNKDGHADEVIRIASGLSLPNGVAFHDRSLYVAEISRIS